MSAFCQVFLASNTKKGRHNMPTHSPRSTRETSFTDSSPSSLVSQLRVAPRPVMSQPAGVDAMSIGSITTEQSIRNDYMSHSGHSFTDLSHLAISQLPRSLPPDLVFQLSPSADSPLYSSDSCTSPTSDYLQPQVSTPQLFTPHSVPRSQSAILESCFQNQQLFTSPLALTPTVPSWEQFEDTALGISYDSPCTPNVSELILIHQLSIST